MSKLDEFRDFPAEITDDPRYRQALWRFRAVVKRVVDGDTLYLLVDKGFRCYDYHPVRVEGYDAPELFRGDEQERHLGRLAREFLESELPPNKPVGIVTREDESFGRYLARVYYVRDGKVVDLADVMREAGHAL